MWTLEEEFSGIEIGASLHFRNLTAFPLIRSRPCIPTPDYLLLEDVIARGLGHVTEIHTGGSVSELRFENMADLPVLLLDGEELVGAKQNRVLNLTILAPPKQAMVIPVSCVEAGRWSMTSPDFKTVDHLLFSRARASRVNDVTSSLRDSGCPRSDQSSVWDFIARKAASLHAESPTGAMSAIFEQHATSVEQYVRAFSYQSGQVGVGFASGGRVLGLDLFDRPEIMQRYFGKLVRSFALDAIDAQNDTTESAPSEMLRQFLSRIASAQSFTQPAIGIGKDVRFIGTHLSGAALWASERFIHICAFPLTERNGGFTSRMSRPSRRGMA